MADPGGTVAVACRQSRNKTAHGTKLEAGPAMIGRPLAGAPEKHGADKDDPN